MLRIPSSSNVAKRKCDFNDDFLWLKRSSCCMTLVILELSFDCNNNNKSHLLEGANSLNTLQENGNYYKLNKHLLHFHISI